jgi:hypothetical protein
MYDVIILYSFVHWARRINKAPKRIRRSEHNLVLLGNKNKFQDKFFPGFLFLVSICFVYTMCPCAVGPLIGCL